MLPIYPQTAALTLAMRSLLHPLFQQLREGLSEFTFANLYLFRRTHNYTISRMADGQTIVILGRDDGSPFFILPFGLPGQEFLAELFSSHGTIKCVSTNLAAQLKERGYHPVADRDNFDYLYRRQDLAELGGRAYHKKRNLIKAFVSSNIYAAKPLRQEYQPDAMHILDKWVEENQLPGDVAAAREALAYMEELQLCGGIYYVAEEPVAYVLGEELGGGHSYAIHFEKAVAGYKGLYQYINQSFASVLPEQYHTINREQDLGDAGLRQAKLSYKPFGFVEKYKVRADSGCVPAEALPNQGGLQCD